MEGRGPCGEERRQDAKEGEKEKGEIKDGWKKEVKENKRIVLSEIKGNVDLTMEEKLKRCIVGEAVLPLDKKEVPLIHDKVLMEISGGLYEIFVKEKTMVDEELCCGRMNGALGWKELKSPHRKARKTMRWHEWNK
ncbi:hypothetical protein PIB30_095027 [Stylosanthes scabra]|uniref:Uncharacterized protein n=1 Tax=Stylosanthes scabra TaxID=79078 RepID=A0ABU6XWN9_9FABA|nr:hypothetical protein [Stylosanthes scabra]